MMRDCSRNRIDLISTRSFSSICCLFSIPIFNTQLNLYSLDRPLRYLIDLTIRSTAMAHHILFVGFLYNVLEFRRCFLMNIIGHRAYDILPHFFRELSWSTRVAMQNSICSTLSSQYRTDLKDLWQFLRARPFPSRARAFRPYSLLSD